MPDKQKPPQQQPVFNYQAFKQAKAPVKTLREKMADAQKRCKQGDSKGS